jgi:hypothetical protein
MIYVHFCSHFTRPRGPSCPIQPKFSVNLPLIFGASVCLVRALPCSPRPSYLTQSNRCSTYPYISCTTRPLLHLFTFMYHKPLSEGKLIYLSFRCRRLFRLNKTMRYSCESWLTSSCMTIILEIYLRWDLFVSKGSPKSVVRGLIRLRGRSRKHF